MTLTVSVCHYQLQSTRSLEVHLCLCSLKDGSFGAAHPDAGSSGHEFEPSWPEEDQTKTVVQSIYFLYIIAEFLCKCLTELQDIGTGNSEDL